MSVRHNEYTSNKDGFSSEPIEDVPITAQLPELWKGLVGLCEASLSERRATAGRRPIRGIAPDRSEADHGRNPTARTLPRSV